jgi:hypothetical protein
MAANEWQRWQGAISPSVLPGGSLLQASMAPQHHKFLDEGKMRKVCASPFSLPCKRYAPEAHALASAPSADANVHAGIQQQRHHAPSADFWQAVCGTSKRAETSTAWCSSGRHDAWRWRGRCGTSSCAGDGARLPCVAVPALHSPFFMGMHGRSGPLRCQPCTPQLFIAMHGRPAPLRCQSCTRTTLRGIAWVSLDCLGIA